MSGAQRGDLSGETGESVYGLLGRHAPGRECGEKRGEEEAGAGSWKPPARTAAEPPRTCRGGRQGEGRSVLCQASLAGYCQSHGRG